jgi:hypothetical protein
MEQQLLLDAWLAVSHTDRCSYEPKFGGVTLGQAGTASCDKASLAEQELFKVDCMQG